MPDSEGRALYSRKPTLEPARPLPCS
jgi:hypothetical protein